MWYTFKLAGIRNPCLNIMTLKRGESNKDHFLLASYADALWACRIIFVIFGGEVQTASASEAIAYRTL